MESEQGEMKKIFKGATIRLRRVKVVVHFWGIDKSKLDKFLYLLGNVSKFFQQVLNLAEHFFMLFLLQFSCKNKSTTKILTKQASHKKVLHWSRTKPKTECIFITLQQEGVFHECHTPKLLQPTALLSLRECNSCGEKKP